MEENSKIWAYCDLQRVLNKLYPKLEVLKKIILTYPGLSQRMLEVEELHAILEKAGLHMVKQEACTLFRAVDSTLCGSVKMTQFLKYIMDLK